MGMLTEKQKRNLQARWALFIISQKLEGNAKAYNGCIQAGDTLGAAILKPMIEEGFMLFREGVDIIVATNEGVAS